MTYRKQLTVLVAEESDIREETEFYGTDDVKEILDSIESRVNEILDSLDDYKKWQIDEISEIMDDIKKSLKDLSGDLY
jgi:di/tripeptidase